MTRSYYDYSPARRFGLGRSLGRATRAIIIGMIVVAVLELFLWEVEGPVPEGESSWWEREVFLTPRSVLGGDRFWQIVTHFMVQPKGGVFALIGSVLILYVFGSDLERHLGIKRYVAFFVACGVGGGLAALAWYSVGPAPYAGADAPIFGVATACALIWPNRTIRIFVPVRTKWVVLVLVGVSVLMRATGGGTRGGVPYVPGLGGPAVAFAVWMLTRFAVRPAPTVETEGTETVDSDRVDEILEKVHERGIGSLTRRERRILEEASAELRRRSGRDGKARRS